ncbi:putative MFS family arabinose efflux permease [Litoreibacter ponti]|uniref:Putative MFS family arabinose efflux permease n=1 Tax=Litoreibacter ponti TaxID=1510457 RepID=A0A2T6BHM6_9RHOB|nr:MFS transporter [Litoreibacter ponti]PTX55568.1 putative MFS family arabinose efflux permease [Litoreibacter ponti]
MTRDTISYIGLLSANTLLGAAMPMLIILGGLAGLMLAPSPALATFPPSVQTLAGLVAAGPFSLLMGRFGRRFGFVVGGVLASIGGIMGLVALFQSSFVLLCAAHMALGAALACFNYFRFAAAEVVPERWQPVAISLMLTSGLIAAFVGPQLFIVAKDLFAPVPLAGAYAAISVLCLVGLLPLLAVRINGAGPAPAKLNLRASAAMMARREVWIAVLMAATSTGVMVLLMAPTPLAMVSCGLSETLAGDVIRWHVVAMFAPSFFTGFAIKRFGARVIVGLGLALLGLSALWAASGLTPTHFYGALIVLGLGWNFGFIGATTMLTAATAPEERAVVQGANDTVVALVATLCAFGGGAIVAGFGWAVLALAALPILGASLAALLWPQLRVTETSP